MCYFLYGAINDEINEADFERASKNFSYHFKTGRKDDVNNSVENCLKDYRITLNHCDCDSPIGSGDVSNKELKDIEQFLINLKSVRGIKHIFLSKNWIQEINTKEENIHIDDIDIKDFLAKIEKNCLYKIEMYPKY